MRYDPIKKGQYLKCNSSQCDCKIDEKGIINHIKFQCMFDDDCMEEAKFTVNYNQVQVLACSNCYILNDRVMSGRF
jgi:hypothetical protein